MTEYEGLHQNSREDCSALQGMCRHVDMCTPDQNYPPTLTIHEAPCSCMCARECVYPQRHFERITRAWDVSVQTLHSGRLEQQGAAPVRPSFVQLCLCVLLGRMSHYMDEPRFTIEQIDLLQRLRRSGLTRREILCALDSLERLEREHVQKFGRRRSPWGGGGAGPGPDSDPAEGRPGPGGGPSSSPNASVATQTAFHAGALSPSPSNYDASTPPAGAAPMPVAPPLPPTQNGRDALVPVSNGKLSPPQYPLAHGPARPFGFEAPEEEMDIDDKVEELMRKDSNIIKEEIKAFLGSRRISQAVVAQVTGISQSRISHWLLQQGSDLSEQKKRAFYRWYQLEKTMPGATLAMKPAPMALEDIVEWPQTAAPIGCSPGSFRLRRGSRFTWRKECLAVMESYFNENQYPDEAKREEIANACNAVIQKPGKKLSDLERVTSLKVYNWFANRRKEIKRRANIEAAILESHGIDVQSPGGQSNGDEADGNEYTDPTPDQSLGSVKTTFTSPYFTP